MGFVLLACKLTSGWRERGRNRARRVVVFEGHLRRISQRVASKKKESGNENEAGKDPMVTIDPIWSCRR